MMMTGTMVQMDIKELIPMLAKEVARQVTDELVEKRIIPLETRAAAVEKRLNEQAGSGKTWSNIRVTLVAFGASTLGACLAAAFNYLLRGK